MARMTVRDFARSVGLTTTGGDYIACTVMLKMLCAKGVAKEVDRINTSSSGRGRKSVVYEVPEQVSFALDLNAPVVEETVEETVVEEASVEAPVEAPVEEVAVEAPVEVAVEAPVEVAVEAPVEVAVEAPVEVAVEAEKFYYDDDDDEAEAA